MSEKVFLAGATGAVGAALIPLLVEAGYTVYGSTRRAERTAALQAQGVHPVVVDVFDAQALKAALVRIAPRAVVHQLTDLPKDLDPARMTEAAVLNARVRTEGTRNLVAAAQAAGAKRLVAQSIAWAYAPGTKPFTEDRPLDVDAQGTRRVSVDGVVALEQAVLGAQGITGTVLRARSIRHRSIPLVPGSMMSRMTRSTGPMSSATHISAPVAAGRTVKPFSWSTRVVNVLSAGSSSTRMIVWEVMGGG
jgi:nucleoside-diphosphate-sugar epimerase